jgi:hypothetical protein
MLHEPVFESPNTLSSLLRRAEARRVAGDRIPDIDLAIIIERHRGKTLPAVITEYLIQHFRGQIKGRKGPKLQSDAVKDFRFGPPANVYDHYLPVFEYLAQRRKRPACKRYNANTGSGYRDGTLTSPTSYLHREIRSFLSMAVFGMPTGIASWPTCQRAGVLTGRRNLPGTRSETNLIPSGSGKLAGKCSSCGSAKPRSWTACKSALPKS